MMIYNSYLVFIENNQEQRSYMDPSFRESPQFSPVMKGNVDILVLMISGNNK